MSTLVDFDRLQSFTEGDRLLEAELAALFLASAEGYLQRLGAALHDDAAWRATAHSLKGAAGNIGAVAMAELAAAAEQASPDPARLRALQATLATTRSSLEGHLDSAGDAGAMILSRRATTRVSPSLD